VGDADDDRQDDAEPQDVRNEAKAAEQKQQNDGDYEPHGKPLQISVEPFMGFVPAMSADKHSTHKQRRGVHQLDGFGT
jgi:hypothetical protein